MLMHLLDLREGITVEPAYKDHIRKTGSVGCEVISGYKRCEKPRIHKTVIPTTGGLYSNWLIRQTYVKDQQRQANTTFETMSPILKGGHYKEV